MTTVVLVRHGLTAMTGPLLAGWTPDLHLDERGQKQAAAVAERLATVPFAAIVSSPLDRCLETAQAIAGDREVVVDDRIGECRYGDWTGKAIKDLAKDLSEYLEEFASKRPFSIEDRPLDLKKLKVVAFVQNDKTKEIYQAAQVDLE